MSYTTFEKAMNHIIETYEQNEERYKEVSRVLGDSEQISEWFDIQPMVRLLELICDDTKSLISTYIWEYNFGKYGMYVKNTDDGSIKCVKEMFDLYDVLMSNKDPNCYDYELTEPPKSKTEIVPPVDKSCTRCKHYRYNSFVSRSHHCYLGLNTCALFCDKYEDEYKGDTT